MAIVVRTPVVASNNGAGGTTTTVTFPSGHVADDVLVFALTVRGGSGVTYTTPSGWTAVAAQTNSGTDLAQKVFWRIDTGSLGSSVVVTHTSGKASAVCYALSGADSTVPAAAQYSGQANASSLTVSYAARSTWSAIDGLDLLFGGMAYGGNTVGTATNYTNGSQGSSTGGSASSRTQTHGSHRALSGVTTVGALSETWTGTAAVNIGTAVFIKRATSFNRANADSIGSLSDNIGTISDEHRTLSDSVSTLSDSVARAKQARRTPADSISSVADAIGRAIQYPRTPADSFVGAGSSSYEATILADTPDGYWRFPYPSSSAVVDVTGSFADGIYYEGTTPETPAGTAGPIIDDDGAFGHPTAYGHWAEIPAAGYNLLTDFSIEFWVRRGQAVADIVVVTKGGSAVVVFVDTNSGKVCLEGNGVTDVRTSTSIGLNAWHHIVLTYGVGALSGKAYMDGKDVSEYPSGGVASFASYASTLRIGSYSTGSPDYTFGAGGGLDELALYSTSVLTPTQVAAHYRAGVGQYLGNVLLDGPSAYYRMGEKPVTVVFACGADGASEPGFTSHWTGSSGTYSQDTTHVRSGTYAWKFPAGGVYLGKSIPSPTQHLVGRLSVWLSAAPNGTSRLFDFSDGQWRSCEVASNGYAYFGQKDAEGYTGGVASTLPFPIAQWVDIDFWVDASANTHYHYWRINGVVQTTHSEAMGGTNNVATFDLIGNTANKDTWIDDVVLSKAAADYPISNGYVNSSDVWVTYAQDEIGTNDGIYIGPPTLGVSGLLSGDADTAVTLNGSSQYVDAPTISLATTSRLTVEAWLRRSGAAPVGTIAWHGENAGDEYDYWVRIVSGTSVAVTVYNASGGDRRAATFSYAFAADTTYHFVVVMDDTTDTITLYINGTQAGQDATAWGDASQVSTARTFVGVRYDIATPQAYFNGTLDEPAIYDYVLTPTQVAAHYAAGSPTSGSWGETLVAQKTPGGGGANFPRTAADSIATLTDALVRNTGTRVRAAADSVGSLTDSLTRNTSTRVRTVADSVGSLSDGLVRGASTRVRTAGDSIGSITDSLARNASTRIRAVSDSVGSATDSIAALKVQIRATSDSVGTLTDGLIRSAATRVRTASDSVGSVTDSIGIIKGQIRGISDTYGTITDSLGSLRTYGRALNDSVGSLTDGLVRGAATRVRTAADSVGSLTVGLSRSAITYGRTAADSLSTATDSIVALKVQLRTVADSVSSITDTVAPIRAYRRAMADAVSSAVDSLIATETYRRTLAETYSSITDSVAALKVQLRTVSDTYSAITDSVSRGAIAYGRTAADSVGAIADSVTSLEAYRRSLSDTVATVTDSIAALKVQLRTFGDTYSTLTDTVARVLTARRSNADTVATLSDTVTRAASYRRALGDSVATITDSISRIRQLARTASDAVGSLTDSIGRALTLNRTTSDTIAAISDSLVRVPKLFTRTVADVIGAITESVVWERIVETPSKLVATVTRHSELITRASSGADDATITSRTSAVTRVVGNAIRATITRRD